MPTHLHLFRPFSETRRRLLVGFAATLAGSFAGYASAQDWPTKAITIVVPYSAGGTTDALARLVGNQIAKQLGQPVVVDNRPGAGGNIGGAAVARAVPDGYTLFLGTIGTHAINAALYRKMPFDHIRDFVPLTRLAIVPNVLVANPTRPYSTVAELIAYARANPGKVTYASAGQGGSQHLSAELFDSMAGTTMQHVPYKGSSPAIQDLIGGQVDIMFDNLPSSLPYLGTKGQPGKLKALGISTLTRAASVPDVPTISEAGLPGYEVSAWFGLLAPSKTPPVVLAKLQNALKVALDDPTVRTKIQNMGGIPVNETSTEFAKFIEKETRKWGDVVRKTGISLE